MHDMQSWSSFHEKGCPVLAFEVTQFGIKRKEMSYFPIICSCIAMSRLTRSAWARTRAESC